VRARPNHPPKHKKRKKTLVGNNVVSYICALFFMLFICAIFRSLQTLKYQKVTKPKVEEFWPKVEEFWLKSGEILA
jgi:hypothetical protein